MILSRLKLDSSLILFVHLEQQMYSKTGLKKPVYLVINFVDNVYNLLLQISYYFYK